jgi:predicted nucleic acid-binding protein
MITALDTNILSALWSAKPFAQAVAATLERFSREGQLVISGPVYAELLAYPGATEDFVDSFLSKTRIALDSDLAPGVWRETGLRFAAYSQRRRTSSSSDSKRLLADFIIGAHALHRAARLFTFDPSRYRRDFPELTLIETV